MRQQDKARRYGIAAVLIAAALVAATVAGCGQPDGTSSNFSPGASTVSGSNAATTQTDIDITFSARDLDVGYEETTATKITLSSGGIAVNGSGADAQGQVITIRSAGTYVLSGSLDDGQVIVEAGEDDKVQLVLNGISVHCETNAALLVRSADKVFLTLAEGSENTLDDGLAYQLSDADGNVDATIFSRADLTINGSGGLTVTGNYKHGIVSKDDLVVSGGTIEITAQGQGMNGKDCVKISGGSFRIQSQGDGIQSDNSEDSGRGFVYISGGTFAIDAQGDAVQAETVLRIDGGGFTLTTGGGSGSAAVKKSDGGMGGRPGGQQIPATGTSDTEPSAKGLKSGSELVINNGSFTIDTVDDALHTSGSMKVTAGDFQISTGDDGLHADNDLSIVGGTITIAKCYEGIEGKKISISGGVIRLTASDDGINAADGSGAAMGGMGTGRADILLHISGGDITISAGGDGLDSNGSIVVDGGSIWINGPTGNGDGAIDYDGSAAINGGTVVAVGSSGMAQGFGESSAQCSIFYQFSAAVPAGTAVTLTDSQGRLILTFTPEKAYQSVVLSAPELAVGQTYRLTAGSQSADLTVSSVVTSNGGGMGGRPGGNNGMGGNGAAPPGNRKNGQNAL